MRVLIIGGTRFIGAHAARAFHKRGLDVTVFHRGRTENRELPPMQHIRDAVAEYPVTRYPHSITSVDWELVVHMVLMGEADAQAATAAFRERVGRFVMISSGDVYRAYGRLTRIEPGPPDPVPLSENAPLRHVLYPYKKQAEKVGPIANYYEKILAERVIQQASALPATILRLPKVYGQEDNGDLATVYGFAEQPGWRWTHGHVANVAEAIVCAALNPQAGGRIYNVGEAETPTMGERLAALPQSEQGPPKPPDFDYRQDMVLNTSRIRDELGFCDILDETLAMRQLISSAARDTDA